MKIKFDSNQDFQLDAIRSVVDVFAGQPLIRSSLEWQTDVFGGELLTEMGVGNSLSLTDETILANVQKIQAENELEPGKELQGLNFSVEMETGTGKTYVYLRTIHELAKTYGSPQGISAHDALRCNYCGNTVHLDHHHMAWYDT